MKKASLIFASIIVAATIQAQPVKKILLEEFTTALCGMCPPQSYNIHQWYEQHPSQSIFLTIHEGFGTDAMSGPFQDSLEQDFSNPSFGFAPAVMIDRVTYPWVADEPYMTVNGFDTIAARVANEAVRASVDLSGTFNASSGQLTATATVNFLQTVPQGNYRITIYLVEDSVIGSGSGWDQKCYDASFANAHYPGQYNASTDLISAYPHRYVLRASLNGAWGSGGIIPSNPVVGTNYTVTKNYTVTQNYNVNKLHLVAFVSHAAAASNSSFGNGNRWVLNANSVQLTPVFSTATGSVATAEVPFSIYPNPATESAQVQFSLTQNEDVQISVTDISGRLISNVVQSEFSQGTHTVSIDTQQLTKGLYVVQLLNSAGKSVQKLLVQ